MKVFDELPPRSRAVNRVYDWASLVVKAKKKKNRGKWVKYPERVNVGMPHHINHARIRMFGDDFEARGFNHRDNLCDLYVRYRGE